MTIMVIDEGTSSVRALPFTETGEIGPPAQRDIAARYPRPGWVEQDAAAIWQATAECARDLAARDEGRAIRAIGLTNQRETLVAWDRDSGEPLAPAIVWQDRRTDAACKALRDEGHEEKVQAVSGLLLDPYFSASKMRWMLDHEEPVSAAAERGTLAFGTIDSWLLFKLTGTHCTDASNASRTALMDLESSRWDEGLCDLFGIPRAALPEIRDMVRSFGTTDLLGTPVPVTASVGDQQSASIGQGCLGPGQAKATFGTGLFALASTGARRPKSGHRLLSTLLLQDGDHRLYALEGSVFVAGSLVKWLRDMAGLVDSAAETEALARSVPDAGGVTIIPAFTGLGAPYWRANLKGSIHGLTFGVTRAHLVRAALEAVTHSCVDLLQAFAADDAGWHNLRVDGGMIANDWLAQDLADMLGQSIERPWNVESTARGAAMLAAAGAGVHEDVGAAIAAMLPEYERFDPVIDEEQRVARRTEWQRLIAHELVA
ncbi:FGGY family carbohydrate kinase [Sphingomicrobium lutaoense]|uniref:ATP:glycerol 3-phosphotransferase n=1 Tax=Sphingomicrobium lutaoense TaxID=515949 RepID=A0A839YWY7_9SPHN|nr:glycerol kinase GlpK [Sphingomicrobium lutaoense]MBB3763000.1 glycerol kinase [Sphingomicrobium lutaoense]